MVVPCYSINHETPPTHIKMYAQHDCANKIITISPTRDKFLWKSWKKLTKTKIVINWFVLFFLPISEDYRPIDFIFSWLLISVSPSFFFKKWPTPINNKKNPQNAKAQYPIDKNNFFWKNVFIKKKKKPNALSVLYYKIRKYVWMYN